MVRRILLVALMVAGCGSDASGPDDAAAGHYALLSVDGAPLPLLLAEEPGIRIELTAGSILLRADGSFTTTTTKRTVTQQDTFNETIPQTGHYTYSGSTVHMTYSDGTFDTATLDDRVLTLVGQGVVFLFRR